MALSEDTIAIVASNLTAAHCALNNPLSKAAPKNGDENRDLVVHLFQYYLGHVRKDVARITAEEADKSTQPPG